MFQSYWSYRSSPLISACYQMFNVDRIFISTWYCFLRRYFTTKKCLSYGASFIGTKQSNLILNITYYVALVIVLLLLLISLRGQHYEHESEENPTYTSLGMVL